MTTSGVVGGSVEASLRTLGLSVNLGARTTGGSGDCDGSFEEADMFRLLGDEYTIVLLPNLRAGVSNNWMCRKSTQSIKSAIR